MNFDNVESKPARGFARLSPEQRKELGRLGGRSVDPKNRFFTKNRDLASAAGKKGGVSVPSPKRAFSVDRELASRAGKVSSRSISKD